MFSAVNSLLHQFRDDLLSAIRLTMAKYGTFTRGLPEHIGEGRDSVHHDKRRAHQRSFNRGRPAGDDSSAREW